MFHTVADVHSAALPHYAAVAVRGMPKTCIQFWPSYFTFKTVRTATTNLPVLSIYARVLGPFRRSAMTGSTGTLAPRLHGAVAVRAYITGIMCTATLVLPHCLNHGAQTQTSSMDRPEYWMLTPITSRPLQTSLCALAGSIISSLLWSRHLQSESGRKSYSASTVSPSSVFLADSMQYLNLGVALALCSAAAHIVLLALGAPLDE